MSNCLEGVWRVAISSNKTLTWERQDRVHTVRKSKE